MCVRDMYDGLCRGKLQTVERMTRVHFRKSGSAPHAAASMRVEGYLFVGDFLCVGAYEKYELIRKVLESAMAKA